jgi:hypothetical protein
MRLYRAVSLTELDDIRNHHGSLRDSKHKSGKGFFFRREDAGAFGRQARAYDSSTYFLIEVDAPEDMVQRGTPHVAACEGPGVYLREEDLAFVTFLLEEAAIE